jgi:decaprenylphospho-beta-D-ribofuranose 2-oxidase
MSSSQAKLWGWGRLPAPGREVRSEHLATLCRNVPLTRGLGRSYGDASLPPAERPTAAGSALADRILEFDPQSGRLRAEAGLSLATLRRLFIERGWFIPVSPGTQFVTLGGLVAADVHGKNHHHAGSIGRHVRSLRMLVADGREVVASRGENADLFRATLGGMGLTGHILEVELGLERIPSPWILQESRRFDSLEPLVAALREASAAWPFTVAWIDLMARGSKAGRGVLFCGRWATAEEAPDERPREITRRRVFFTAPNALLNVPFMRLYNALQFRRRSADARTTIVHPERYFYPLDDIEDWNRLYGRRGFIQYQCLLPAAALTTGGIAPLDSLLARMRELGGKPFLTVLKDFGEAGEGLLSFPAPGLTICLDFPVGPGTQELVDGLNDCVLAAGGRVYLAKDAFTRPEHFRRMEPRLSEFDRVKRRWDPEGRLDSRQWQRLRGTAPVSLPELGEERRELAPVGGGAGL